ncbi:hydroxymethylbilane synthase [Nocardioides daeguensis]|uniref:Porphobilinogen deaminase n=1 Tax=Nocardioides daeguensis TaxID=908359 RepID=A0ABP6UZZ4_9ACTN|nr:hydroxymethylbilane synthase [Nocardioides daeguensis]MBV6726972.1 hydroxymethylbilane synthase [Nocardioides daeguensis]MCR1771624.1 hydroxymethylbilane synthase [Nocardioides daeguensis]
MAALRIGTRRSILATTQSGHVADALEALGTATELVEITTDGDRSQAGGVPLTGAPSTGVFVSALRDALLAGEVDVAVHSLKDLPTYSTEGIVLAAVPPREDPRDVVVARDGLTLGELPPGSKVATGSPRRVAQIEALGLGVELVGVRGNVDTRIGRIAEGTYDAVVLARAGLARLGRADEATEVLDPLQVLPAPGQGALAVECRSDDTATLALLARLDDAGTRAAVTAERTLMATLEGGCAAPIGALAEVADGDEGPELWLRAVILSEDGALSLRRSASAALGADGASWAADAAKLGGDLGAEMLADGAAELMAQLTQPRGEQSRPTDSNSHPSARSAEVPNP